MSIYTIRQITNIEQIDNSLWEFLDLCAKGLSEKYNNQFNWQNFDIGSYITFGRFMICYSRDKPVGVMLSRLSPSILDPKKAILTQDVLYTVSCQRATYWLLRDFIDFGKKNADFIMTMIGEKTNIKKASLEKLGFKKVEELYEIEVQRG